MKSIIIILSTLLTTFGFAYTQSSANFSYTWLTDSACARPDYGYIINLHHSTAASDASVQWSSNHTSVVNLSNSTGHTSLLSINPSGGAIPSSVAITLEVTDTLGTTVSNSETIALNLHYAPVVRISPSFYETGCAPWGVEFSNESYSMEGTALTGFLWDFGDENSSQVENPSHTFENSGTFTVSLTVTDNTGCSSNNVDYLQATIIEVKPTEECE